MKKPYIKKYGKISTFTVWIVSGPHIRETLDREFTNFGQHYRFRFIPENEFWIDKENQPGEARFYIDHLLVEHRLMFHGKSYKEALAQADLVEQKERAKSWYVHAFPRLKNKNLFIEKIHKMFLKKYSKNISVWLVRGDLVRSLFFIDFTEGGHDKVYRFIPPHEVWIDDDVSRREMKFILLHELHERFLMSRGMSYDAAHKRASEIEYFCRHHLQTLDATLTKEMTRNSR